MAYNRLHDPWPDGDADAPVDGESLTHIEDGIEEAHNLAAAAQATADAAGSQQLPYIREDTVEQKGDLIAGAGFGDVIRLPLGAANQTIFPDATATGGIAWGSITGSRISGFPSDASKFLRGDGAWAAPSGGIAPSHIGASHGASGLATVIANRAYLAPLYGIIATGTYTRIGFHVGTPAGNYDVGVYFSDDEATFTRLASLGSTAMPSAGSRHALLSAFTITPVAGRRWYLAFAASAAASVGVAGTDAAIYAKDSNFPLPASMTSMLGPGGIITPYLIGMV